MNETKHNHEVLWDLIKDTRFCMLSHRHADGSLHSHPLTMQNKALDEGDMVWFFVSRTTEVGQRLRQDGNVNLSFANVKDDTWVSITGTASVIEDLQKKKDLFNPIAKAWFDGPEDPNLELVGVRIEEAEFWNVKENKLLQLLKMGTAAVTGNRPKMGEHKEIHFNN
ncbi:pyridoxamine 5'-phosphate oxidase family protein [Ramlibacter pallidus]|uniref:Pyridoxamine 5'-phosphate oxidase family protein n=1 Tax=Ramlibacter pallidus TaxID=2780087 RepID=A0ABR9S0J7_9BURK|nr:pyridoxamine 5'-phosphate oxidase family protein [Ramlibacter pallidus]MBE7367008.1 pyridoxamine 5'-phosphate oxidase family protein [Ramlibacter pallidus]